MLDNNNSIGSQKQVVLIGDDRRKLIKLLLIKQFNFNELCLIFVIFLNFLPFLIMNQTDR